MEKQNKALKVDHLSVESEGCSCWIPACMAINFSQKLSQYASCSIPIGAISSMRSILLHDATGGAAGPLILLASSGLFAGSVALMLNDSEKSES